MLCFCADSAIVIVLAPVSKSWQNYALTFALKMFSSRFQHVVGRIWLRRNRWYFLNMLLAIIKICRKRPQRILDGNYSSFCVLACVRSNGAHPMANVLNVRRTIANSNHYVSRRKSSTETWIHQSLSDPNKLNRTKKTLPLQHTVPQRKREAKVSDWPVYTSTRIPSSDYPRIDLFLWYTHSTL